MKTRCLLVDDEPIALSIIQNHVGKLDNLEVTGTCSNALEAFKFLKNHEIDLMFLDIQMPQITGLELLRSLKNPPRVIIISAYREFAVEGFELDVIDYLVKPVSFERFLKSVDKYYDLKAGSDPVKVSDQGDFSKNPFIWIRADRKNLKILLNTIRYIEGLRDYVKIYTDKEMIISKSTIKDLQKKLPDDDFIRIHRSYLVAKNKIQAYTTEHIEIGNNILPIGPGYRSAVMSNLAY